MWLIQTTFYETHQTMNPLNNISNKTLQSRQPSIRILASCKLFLTQSDLACSVMITIAAKCNDDCAGCKYEAEQIPTCIFDCLMTFSAMSALVKCKAVQLAA